MDFKSFDRLFEGVIGIGRDFKIFYMNDSAKNILEGMTIGDSCKDIFSICNSCPMNYIKEEKEGIQVYDTITKDKHLCWSMSPIFEDGNFIGAIEIFKDVSNVVSCIIEANRQKAYKEGVLNSIVEAILVLDKDGYIKEHNQIAKRMLCREETESLLNKHIKELINLSLEEFPPEGERSDVYINTPCGRQKASMLLSSMQQNFGYVLSLYVVQEPIVCTNGGDMFLAFKSPKFQKMFDVVRSSAEYDVNVLIEGETGSGKTFIARYIHKLSPRRDKPFIHINCAAIPDTLLEAELFGYIKGAFTGALKDKPGKVEIAEGGTLFLDEIGDMPMHLQAKILHLVQEKIFERLGDITPRKANIRIIASTNKNLKELSKYGHFREDLYYRLGVVKLYIPPLRERKEDLPALINYFLDKYSKAYSKKIKGISSEAMKLFLSYEYPGNIRELENLIERAVITAKASVINVEDLNIDLEESFSNEEKEKIRQVLEQVKGNKSLAAKMLGMHRTTLWRKMKELGI